ncbi:MAG: hypothetical protein HQL23_05960 [Candidatus Omnitrophica bacterium]|nr:hypothetical protein [Candidatus Omnitrophota bacterium]
MRKLSIFLSLVIAGIVLAQMIPLNKQRAALRQQIREAEQAARDAERERDCLAQFKTLAPQPLAAVFSRVITEVNALGAANHAPFVIKILGLGNNAPVDTSFMSSDFFGIKKCEMEISLTQRFTEEEAALLLDGLSALERANDVSIQRVTRQEDNWLVKMVLYGI